MSNFSPVRRLLILDAVIFVLAASGARSSAAPLSDSQLFYDPQQLTPDFYSRILLPDLLASNSYVDPSGGDPIVDIDILPTLKTFDYPLAYTFTQSDYLLQPNVDYFADLTAGTMTASFTKPGLYHVRTTRQSGAIGIQAILAESDLKEKTGAPNKTGPNGKLDPLPNADLFLVEESDSTMDNSAKIWRDGGRTVERVKTREETIEKIKKKSEELGRKIHVEIDGHGTSGNISTGAGKNNIAEKQIDLTSVEDFQKKIDEYVNFITFQGCSVGSGADGLKFLQILAASIGKAGAWTEEVTVNDSTHFSVSKTARFVVVPEPGTDLLAMALVTIAIGARRARGLPMN